MAAMMLYLCFFLAFMQSARNVEAGADNDISLLVIGKTGVGKSSTANTILGRKVFVSKQSTISITQNCQVEYAEQQGRKIMVVDTPGLSDAELSPEDDLKQAIKHAADAVGKTTKGYDAIILVVAYGNRFTQEDKRTVEHLKAIFGAEYLKQYGILVVTHGDQYDPEENDGQTFDEWCSAQKGNFKELIQECEGRVILFHNKYDMHSDIDRRQLEDLFNMVDTLKRKGRRYHPEVFNLAQEGRDRLVLEQEKEVITQETHKEISLILQSYENIIADKSAQSVETLKKLKERIDTLIDQIQHQYKETGLLDSLTKSLKFAQISITQRLKDAEDGITSWEQNLKFQEGFAQLNTKFEEMSKEKAYLEFIISVGIECAVSYFLGMDFPRYTGGALTKINKLVGGNFATKVAEGITIRIGAISSKAQEMAQTKAGKQAIEVGKSRIKTMITENIVYIMKEGFNTAVQYFSPPEENETTAPVIKKM